MDSFRRLSTLIAINGQDVLLKLLLENSVSSIGGVATVVVTVANGFDGDEIVLMLFFQKESSNFVIDLYDSYYVEIMIKFMVIVLFLLCSIVKGITMVEQ